MSEAHQINLTSNTELHKPKNVESKYDDKHIYAAMMKVKSILDNEFQHSLHQNNLEIEYSRTISFKQIHSFIDYTSRSCKSGSPSLDDTYMDRKINPDGGGCF